MRITHRQLEGFLHFMETGTVTLAAERLFVSQPAMSKMLAGLEIDLNLKLFEREKKRLVPTDEAELLHKEVRRLFSSLTDIERFAQDLREFRLGELRIITATSIGHTLIAEAMVEFASKYQDVQIKIDTSTTVASDVLRQNVDLGFSVAQFQHPSLDIEALFHAEAVCVFPKGHRLAQLDKITPPDLDGEDFVSYTRDSRMRHITDAAFEQQRVARKMRLDVFTSAEANALVSRGLGVAIVEPLGVHFGSWPNLEIRPFVPALEFTYSLMRPQDRGDVALANRFMDILRPRIAALADRSVPFADTLNVRLPRKRS